MKKLLLFVVVMAAGSFLASGEGIPRKSGNGEVAFQQFVSDNCSAITKFESGKDLSDKDKGLLCWQTDGKIFVWDGAAWRQSASGGSGGGGGSTEPGGVDRQVQFNDHGVFAGASGIEYDKASTKTQFSGTVVIPNKSDPAPCTPGEIWYRSSSSPEDRYRACDPDDGPFPLVSVNVDDNTASPVVGKYITTLAFVDGLVVDAGGNTARVDVDLSEKSIGELSDVDTSSASNGDVLKFDGSKWSSGTDDTGNDEADDLSDNVLSDLSDVSSTSPTTGQVLKWTGTEWAPGADNTGSGGGSSDYAVALDTDKDGTNPYVSRSGDDVLVDPNEDGTVDVRLQASTGDDGTISANGALVLVADADSSGGEKVRLDGYGQCTALETNSSGDILCGTDDTGNDSADDLSDNILDDIGDVNASSPADGECLKYSTSSAAWVPGSCGAGGGSDNPHAEDLDVDRDGTNPYVWYGMAGGQNGNIYFDLGSDGTTDLGFEIDEHPTIAAQGDGLRIDGGAVGLWFVGFSSCSALETDATGKLLCGTDDTGGGSGSSEWAKGLDEDGDGTNAYVSRSSDTILLDADKDGAADLRVEASTGKNGSIAADDDLTLDADADSDSTGVIVLPDYPGCSALETDASGHLACGTDDTGNDSADDLSDNVLSDLSDVSTASPSSGQVLKWNGTAWAPGTDETGSGGSSGPTTDDAVLVGNGSGSDEKVIPDCAGEGQTLNYRASDNTWLCLSDDSGGAGTSDYAKGIDNDGDGTIEVESNGYSFVALNPNDDGTRDFIFGNTFCSAYEALQVDSGGTIRCEPLSYGANQNLKLSDLSDVNDYGTITDGYVLTWDGTANEWQPKAAPSGGGGSDWALGLDSNQDGTNPYVRRPASGEVWIDPDEDGDNAKLLVKENAGGTMSVWFPTDKAFEIASDGEIIFNANNDDNGGSWANRPIQFLDYTNCTLKTDASGWLQCGTDETGGGAGDSAKYLDDDGDGTFDIRSVNGTIRIDPGDDGTIDYYLGATSCSAYEAVVTDSGGVVRCEQVSTVANQNLELSELHDVADGLAPADGQVLKWNAASSQWEAGDDQTGGGGGSSAAIPGQTTTVIDDDFFAYDVTNILTDSWTVHEHDIKWDVKCNKPAGAESIGCTTPGRYNTSDNFDTVAWNMPIGDDDGNPEDIGTHFVASNGSDNQFVHFGNVYHAEFSITMRLSSAVGYLAIGFSTHLANTDHTAAGTNYTHVMFERASENGSIHATAYLNGMAAECNIDTGFTPNTLDHTYRIAVDRTAVAAEFYIDGDLKATCDLSGTNWTGGPHQLGFEWRSNEDSTAGGASVRVDATTFTWQANRNGRH